MLAESKLQAAQDELARLDQRREQLVALIRQLAQDQPGRICESTTHCAAPITNGSPPEKKIAFFRALFRGREDVFPRRFESQ